MVDLDLMHIRVGKEMKKQMEKLVEIGLFSTESEIAREGIRNIILKYLSELDKKSKEQAKAEKAKERNEKNK
jgi:Arc/MetJ-type ribon-helix-helix transcriptional regulator